MKRALLLFAVAAGCGNSPAPPAVLPSIDAANALPASDPRYHGQYQFLYDTWDTEVLDEWPPADFMLALMTSEPDVFGNQFSQFGFLPDAHDDFPVGFKRGIKDATKVHESCSMCHVGKLPDGRTWMGAPNEQLDLGRFSVEVNQRWVAAGHPSMMSALAQQKALQLGPGRFDAESGDYPVAVPADFPPYFTLSERSATNYLGTGRNVRTEAFLSIYTFGAGSPNPMTAVVPFPDDDRTATFLDFFGNLAPPAQATNDATAVAAGQAVFASAKCGDCHHVGQLEKDGVTTIVKAPAPELQPGASPMYPRGTIATDALHRVLVDGATDPGTSDGGAPSDGGGIDTGYLDLLHFIEDHNLQAAATDGYRVNDLRGLWATAPYLHNGSVATLDDLLKPAAMRPQTWTHLAFTLDTTISGNGAAGHEFGTTLSASDKTALIAYLNSL